MPAAHIVMASAQRAVAAHSHVYESRQSSSTTSYPVREQSSMASRKCRPGLGHPVREYVEIGHDPQRLTRPAGPWPAPPRADLAPRTELDNLCACIAPRPVEDELQIFGDLAAAETDQAVGRMPPNGIIDNE